MFTAIGAVTGGVGSSVVAIGFKQGAIQAAKSSTAQALSKVGQGAAVGGATSGLTSAAVQVSGSTDGSIDGTKVAIDSAKAVIAGSSGGTVTAVFGGSTVVKAASAVVSAVIESKIDVPYKKEEN